MQLADSVNEEVTLHHFHKGECYDEIDSYNARNFRVRVMQ